MSEFSTVHFTGEGEGTGLFSHAEIQRLMDSECRRATRYKYPVTSMMIAVDRLDQLGDLYGSESRDEILSEVNAVLRRNTRESDYLGCMVGHHFLAIFPHAAKEVGPALATRLLQDTSKLVFDAGSSSVQVSLSIGLVHREAGEKVAFESIHWEVHDAVTQAIAAGGNRFEVYTPPAPIQAAVPDFGDSLQDVGAKLEEMLSTKVEAIFESMGVALPDFGGNQKEVLERAVRKMEAAHDKMREEHAQQVELLERRLSKLSTNLETAEGQLRGGTGSEMDLGVASIYRSVQGLSDVENDQVLKKEMMAKIFEANMELRNELSQKESKD
jgi:diguanylate cyclase (GGDEF)-like protein